MADIIYLNGTPYDKDIVFAIGKPGYADPQSGLRPFLQDLLVEILKRGVISATSASQVTVGAGSKSFVLADSTKFTPGQILMAATQENPAIFMYGQVTAFNPSTKTVTIQVNSDGTSGSGPYTGWNISVTGLRGAQGIQGATVVSYNDSTFNIFNNADPSKQIFWDASLLAPSTQVQIKVPNKSGTVALLDDIVTISDYVMVPLTTITAGMVAGTEFVSLPDNPVIANRLDLYVGGVWQIPGTDIKLKGDDGADTVDTTKVKLVGFTADKVGEQIYGRINKPRTNATVTTVSAGAINRTHLQNAIVDFSALAASVIGGSSDFASSTPNKLAKVDDVVAYADRPGRRLQSKLIQVTTTQSFTNTAYADVPGFSDSFTPLKANSRLRVTFGAYLTNSTAGANQYAKVLINGADAVKVANSVASSGNIQSSCSVADITPGTAAALPIKLQTRVDSGTGRLNLNSPGAALEAGLNSFILIEEIAG